MWELVYEKELNQGYQGPAEQCDYTFTVNLPDQLGSRWRAQDSMNAHIVELQKQGSIILEYSLWEDKTPTLTTDYYVRVIASASPLIWAVIIVGSLILLGLIAVWAITGVKDIVEYLGGEGGQTLKSIVTGLAIISVVTVVGIYLIKKPKAKTQGG